MIRGLYTAASGMITKQIQQEILSNNIANMNTPGYKKDKTALKSFEKVMLVNSDKNVAGKNMKANIGQMEFGVGIDETKTFFDQGVIEDTGRNLDFAINGDGFFTLQDDKNNIKYSRDGRFSVKENGTLVNTDGLKVMGIDGLGKISPIVVSKSDFKVSESGEINDLHGNTRFLISTFNNISGLIKDTGNTFKTGEQPSTSSNYKLQQNALERSNVDSIEAITEMITISRSYESNQKVLQQMDETLGKTVNEVGSVR